MIGADQSEATLNDRIDAAVAGAVRGLAATRRADGSWADTLPSAATSTASSIIALHLAAPDACRDLIEGGVRWLLKAQDSDGGWGEAVGAPASVNATAMAIAGLLLCAPAEAAALDRGWDRFDRMGGLPVLDDLSVSSLGPVCQQYFAIAGRFDESRMVRIPLELSLFPAWIKRRYCFSFPGLMSWGLMQAKVRKEGPLRCRLNALATPKALAFLRGLVEFEGPDGGFEESPLMVALVCIGLTRAGQASEIVDHCVRYLRATVRPDGSWAVTRDLEFTATALLTIGLHESAGEGGPAGLDLAPTEQWIRRFQMTEGFGPTGCPPGGWQWSKPSGWPGSLDTADGLRALAGFADGPGDENLRRGVRWLLEMQNADGSWSYFCRNSRLPVDSPCSLMTAHAVTALQTAGGLTAADRPVARAADWLCRAQRPDGAVTTSWYVGLTAGTGSALAALARLGLADRPAAGRYRDWLLGHQNPDGGWGDGQGSPSSVEDTAWALLGLAECEPDSPAALRAADWLLARQQPDGQWPPALVGLYMHNLLFASDHFATGFALQALGRLRAATAGRAHSAGRSAATAGEQFERST